METKTQSKINVNVNPKGITHAYVKALFDIGKQDLEEEGYDIISLEENAKLRIQEYNDSNDSRKRIFLPDVSRQGNWTREGSVYVPKKGIFLTKNSPVMEDSEEATWCNKRGREFYLNDKQIEKSLADCVELTNAYKLIPTTRFADNEITVYIFGSEANAKNYGEFLKQLGINDMPISIADMQNKPFVRQMWFSGLEHKSKLRAGNWDLACANMMRGVLKKTGETKFLEELD